MPSMSTGDERAPSLLISEHWGALCRSIPSPARQHPEPSYSPVILRRKAVVSISATMAIPSQKLFNTMRTERIFETIKCRLTGNYVSNNQVKM